MNMGKIEFRQRQNLGVNANTKSEFARDVSEDEVSAILKKLCCGLSARDQTVCYVFGMGAHPKSSYESIREFSGVKVIYSHSVLPRALRLLSPLVASYQGLVKINDAKFLPLVFLKLMKQSMVGVYCFDKRIENEFLNATNKVRTTRKYDFGIKADPGYSLYMVDADNDESATGMLEIVSYGVQTPNDLIPA